MLYLLFEWASDQLGDGGHKPVEGIHHALKTDRFLLRRVTADISPATPTKTGPKTYSGEHNRALNPEQTSLHHATDYPHGSLSDQRRIYGPRSPGMRRRNNSTRTSPQYAEVLEVCEDARTPLYFWEEWLAPNIARSPRITNRFWVQKCVNL